MNAGSWAPGDARLSEPQQCPACPDRPLGPQGLAQHLRGHRSFDAVRFLAKVQTGAGCWIWTGAKSDTGYGSFGLFRPKKQVLAHRYAYELLIGPVPEGLTLDHLCRNRLCVNPAHLEPVTMAVNILRGDSPPAQHARATHCKRGHPKTEENRYYAPDGRSPICLPCSRARALARLHGKSVEVYA